MPTVAVVVALTASVVLLATWFGYPWLIGRLASRRPSPERAAEGTFSSVSVVLATRESEEAIQRRIENLRETDYAGDFEIIVGLDSTHEPMPEDGDSVRFVRRPPPGGKALALNAAIHEARGDVVVFADTYQLFDRRTIPELLSGFHHDSVAAVSGLLQLPSDQKADQGGPLEWYWAMERRLRANEARIHSTVGVTGAVYALRRDRWEDLTAGLILDDVFTPMRLILDGHRVHFVDTAFAYETRTPSEASQYRRKVRTLTGVLQLCLWLPGILLPWRNPIWIQFFSHKLLRLASPFCLIAIGIAVLALLLSNETAARATLVALALGVLGLMIPVNPMRRLRRILYTLTLTQLATLTAVSNGIRRRWDVW